jgi:hypothetical protein
MDICAKTTIILFAKKKAARMPRSVMRRLVGPAVIQAPTATTVTSSVIKPKVSALNSLKAEIFGQPYLNPDYRTVHTIFTKPLLSRKVTSYWQVPEVWDWPRAQGVEWTDFKRLSIREKVAALAERGKGPLAKSSKKK